MGPCFLQRRSAYVRLFLSPQDSQEKNANPVKAEEAKLKAKYPGLGQKPGGSDFLMKRLQKGVGDQVSGSVMKRITVTEKSP